VKAREEVLGAQASATIVMALVKLKKSMIFKNQSTLVLFIMLLICLHVLKIIKYV
jgi:hypothetical protein